MRASTTRRNRRRSSTLRRRAAVLAATLCTAALALAAAGCGGSNGSGVARIGSTTSNSSGGSSPAKRSASPLAYSRCMRSHGVANFPDPDSDGRLSIVSGASHGHQVGIDVHSPQFVRAQRACQRLLPGGRPNLGAQQQQTLKFARCMRAHGVPRFPDPSADGEITIDKGSPGVDVRSPQFQAAQKACHALVPGRLPFWAGH